MESPTTQPTVAHSGTETSTQLCEDWFDPIESMVRDQVRHFIQGIIEAELEEALARPFADRRRIVPLARSHEPGRRPTISLRRIPSSPANKTVTCSWNGALFKANAHSSSVQG